VLAAIKFQLLIRIVSVVSNDIITDNRVHKIALSLGANGYEVTIAGRRFKDSEGLFDRPYYIKRFQLWFNKGPLFYLNLNIRLFFYLLKNKPDIILANDLDTLLGCYLASRFTKKHLVFDSHELFPEVPELVDRPATRKIWLWLERKLVPKVKWAFTVSRPIALYYKDRYDVNFELVRNVARFRYDYEFEDLEKQNGISTIIYQGSINLGRGLELAIRSIKHLENAQLWIVGDGDIRSKMQQLAKHLGLSDRIKFFGRIPIEELWKYTAKANLGISLEEDLGLNYRYALPNKLFDYIQARIPVVVSDLPEMAAIVNEYGVGEVLSDRTPQQLANTITNLLDTTNTSKDKKAKIELAARELSWEREEEKLITLFKSVHI
jgi:glycosyltransferase involved in cell wall biosynthesis